MAFPRWTAALVAALAVTGAGGAAVASADDSSTSDTNSGRHVVLDARTQGIERFDVGAVGPSMGDSFVLRNDLLDRRGNVVGLSAGNFVMVTPGQTPATSQYLATVAVSLPQGDITLSGLMTPAEDNVIAITGGTRAYRTAHGQMSFTPKDADNVNRYVLRLHP
jgi:hypothetical protein